MLCVVQANPSDFTTLKGLDLQKLRCDTMLLTKKPSTSSSIICTIHLCANGVDNSQSFLLLFTPLKYIYAIGKKNSIGKRADKKSVERTGRE